MPKREIGGANTGHPRCKATYPPASTWTSKTLSRCRKKAQPGSEYCRDCNPATETRRKAEKELAGSCGRMSKEERRKLEWRRQIEA